MFYNWLDHNSDKLLLLFLIVLFAVPCFVFHETDIRTFAQRTVDGASGALFILITNRNKPSSGGNGDDGPRAA